MQENDTNNAVSPNGTITNLFYLPERINNIDYSANVLKSLKRVMGS